MNNILTRTIVPLKARLSRINFSFSLEPRLSIREQTFFAKRLAFLMRAGVPLLESLNMIREQTKSKNYIRVLDVLIEGVSNGRSLSSSLSRFKKMFGNFAVNIIAIGESTGILADNLEYLAEELKKKQALHKKIVGAFIYPIIVTVATIGITVFLMVYLFPKIMPIFASLHYELPITTRVIIWLSNFLRHNGFVVLGLLIAFVITVVVAKRKSKKFRFFFDRNILRLPIIGGMVKFYNMANCTRTLSLLLKSGISLSESLPITADTIENVAYREELELMERAVMRGEKFSTRIALRTDIFPEVLSQLVSVGERSGDLQHSLMYVSEFCEHEVEDFTRNLSNLIEPVLMIFMGLMVGFIAVSIITPIYGITQHLTPH